MLTYLAIISIFSIFYAYFGYPLLLSFIEQYGSDKRAFDSAYDAAAKVALTPETVTIIIAARNEESHIRDKLESTLRLSFSTRSDNDQSKSNYTVAQELESVSPRVQVIVADDASIDGTEDIVRSFASRGVILSRLKDRGGKELAQKEAAKIASGEIVIFTDTKVELEQGAIPLILSYFPDPSVGAISSVDKVIDSSKKSGEGLYVKYEMRIRELESKLSSLVGLSGSCFAVRKEIALEIDERIPSDFGLLMATIRRGLRGRHAPDVVAIYHAVVDADKEFNRKVRTVLRGMSALFLNIDVLNPARFGFFSFQIISHKLYRWGVPIFFLVLLFSSFLLSGEFIWGLIFLAQLLFMVAGYASYVSPDLRSKSVFKLCLFLLLSNAAILVAWYKYLSGERLVAWDPSQKG
ncbi:MAG TPA: glycosyltransferase [Oligoflexia bacterium]|nr:glycosyltransferase [Oligoflexia bacterium]HMP49038.1 glycosyltransferase [Oligoflexia bacterium]